MTLRSDHIAGGVFVAFGLLVFALSGDLPVGTLSFPGAGMMPKLVAGLVILFGLLLILPSFGRNKQDMERMMGLDSPVDFIEDQVLSTGQKLLRLPGLLATLVRLRRRFAHIERRRHKRPRPRSLQKRKS